MSENQLPSIHITNKALLKNIKEVVQLRTGKERAKSHINEDKSIEIFKRLLPVEWVVRKYDPDYGIDLGIELFEENNGKFYTQGEFLYIQVKSIENPRYCKTKIFERMNVEKEPSLSKANCFFEIEVLKYVIDTSLLATVEKMGSAVPVLMVAVDLNSEEIYYICLNDYIEKVIIPTNPLYFNQKRITLNIPTRNKFNELSSQNIISWYAKRAKLFAFFNKVAYQYHELQYSNGDIELAKHFSNILIRLDAWSASKYFPALEMAREKFFYFYKHGQAKDANEILSSLNHLGYDFDALECEEIDGVCEAVSLKTSTYRMQVSETWKAMVDIGRIFEDIIKECNLPTYIGYDMAI